ncbi:hypothetical protein J6590_067546 [Homalodisca vitripennis]|nr:hypothetical protein J6590_067546 [Homalodisca vitripennis]
MNGAAKRKRGAKKYLPCMRLLPKRIEEGLINKIHTHYVRFPEHKFLLKIAGDTYAVDATDRMGFSLWDVSSFLMLNGVLYFYFSFIHRIVKEAVKKRPSTVCPCPRRRRRTPIC